MRRGELTIGGVFANAARAAPRASAVALGERIMSFAQLDAGADATIGGLSRLGVGRGDVVMVWSATSLDVVPLFAGLAKTGAVYAPISATLRPEEAAGLVAAAQPALLLVDAEHADAGEALAADTGVPLAHITGLADGRGAQNTAGPGSSLAHRAADTSGDALGDAYSGISVAEDDPHVIFFTSGSTGRPKGVVLSHRVNVLRTHPGALLEPRGAMVCPYPLFHMGAWTIALQQWQARACVVLLDRPDAPSILGALVRHGATRLNAIPAVWRRILECVDRPEASAALQTLRVADTGTSATPVELLEAIGFAAPHAHMRVFYGSTEAGSVASLSHEDFGRKPGSCGVPSPGVEVRLAESGELLVRSPLLFDGYYRDDATTAEAFDGDWYRSGDLADVDDEGYLTIVGRVGDVIRTGGETVAPSEVEAVVATHPALLDVAIVGVPDTTWGEVVCAVVVAAAGFEAPSPEDLRAFAGDRLAPFKLPRRVVAVDAIPRTSATRQVMRRLLVERFT